MALDWFFARMELAQAIVNSMDVHLTSHIIALTELVQLQKKDVLAMGTALSAFRFDVQTHLVFQILQNAQEEQSLLLHFDSMFL